METGVMTGVLELPSEVSWLVLYEHFNETRV